MIFRRVLEPDAPLELPSSTCFNDGWFSHVDETTAALPAVAAEEWALDWDDDAGRWLPEYADGPDFPDPDPPNFLEFDVADIDTGLLERWETRHRNGRIRCTKRDVPSPALVLVGCGLAKREGPARARELYTSSLFAAHWKLAQRYTDVPVRILSAEHHVLDPERVINFYERSLKAMTAPERSAWDAAIAAWIRANVAPGSSIIVLAGAEYVRWRSLLPDFDVLEPLARLPLGERLQLAFPKPARAVRGSSA